MGLVLVAKMTDKIIISKDGKKLIINKDDLLFDKLNNLTKEEIKKWYLEGR